MPSPENSVADSNVVSEEPVFGARVKKRFFRRRQGPPPFTKLLWWRLVEDHLPDCSGVSRPVPRFCHAMCSTQLGARAAPAQQSPCDGLLFLFGGYDVDSRFNDVWAFSPLQLRWIQKPILGTPPAARHSHAGVFVCFEPVPAPTIPTAPNIVIAPLQFPAPHPIVSSQDPNALHSLTPKEPYLVFFGGAIKGGNALDDTLILHIGSDAWTWCKLANRFSSDVPPGRYGHTMTYCPRLKSILLFGGHNGTQYFSDLWIFHVESLAWERKMTTGDRPHPRWCHSAILLGSKLFIFGGRGANKRLFNDIYVLDTERFDFSLITACGQVPPPMYGHSAVHYRPRMFLVHGGWDEKSMSNDTYLFNADSIEWFRLDIPEPPLGRTCHTSVYFEFPVSSAQKPRPQNQPSTQAAGSRNAAAPVPSAERRTCAIMFGGYSNGRCTNENYMLEYTDLDCKQREDQTQSPQTVPPPLGRRPTRFSFFRGLFDWIKPDEDAAPTTALAETENLDVQEVVVLPGGYGAISRDPGAQIFEDNAELVFDGEDGINSMTPLRRQMINPPQNVASPLPSAPPQPSQPARTHFDNNAFGIDSLTEDDNKLLQQHRVYPPS